jgi:hypothetical protein
MRYQINTYADDDAVVVSRISTCRRDTERVARAMPGHVEVWLSWSTRVGLLPHRRVLVVRDGVVTARARRARVGCEETRDVHR